MYVAARSEAKAHAAIENICANDRSIEAGKLVFLPLDLADLDSVVEAAEVFSEQEIKLDVVSESDSQGLEYCWLEEVRWVCVNMS